MNTVASAFVTSLAVGAGPRVHTVASACGVVESSIIFAEFIRGRSANLAQLAAKRSHAVTHASAGIENPAVLAAL